MNSITKTCEIKNCDKPTVGRGWCNMHYSRWKRHGNPIKRVKESHGMHSSPEYGIWCHIKERCNNSNNKHYHNYGQRGIKVCDRWQKSFLAFYEDMGKRPIGMTLERINNNGNYESSNCKWATRKEQGNNTRRNVILIYKGRSQNVTQWCTQLGIRQQTMFGRIKRGWSTEKIITTKVIKKQVELGSTSKQR